MSLAQVELEAEEMDRRGRLVTVVVPVYRAERYLDECVSSILNQVHHELELILVDDGSPDSSGELCEQWALRDSRVRVIHQLNAGVSAARNAGVDAARGQYLAFVDADDWISPDMLGALVEALDSGNADVAVCSYSVATKSGLSPGGGPRSSFVCDSKYAFVHLCLRPSLGVMVWNKMFRVRCLENVRFRHMPDNQSEDFDFVIEALKSSRRVACIPAFGYFYRQTSGSLMHSGTVSMSGIAVARSFLDYIRLHHPDIEPYAGFLYASYVLDAYIEICRNGTVAEHRQFLAESRPAVRSALDFARVPAVSSLLRQGLAQRVIWHLARYPPEVLSLGYKLRRLCVGRRSALYPT